MAEYTAKFSIGDVVKHKHFEFRGVVMMSTLNLIILKSGMNQFRKM